MTAVILRVLIFVAIFAFVAFGIRRIWRDWQRQFKAEDAEVRQRDLEERKRPDVITLKRDKDGTFRPPEVDDRR